MAKGSISIEDAQIVQEFAHDVQSILHFYSQDRLVKRAQTVGRIAYCAIADARAKARAERLAQGGYSDPYTIEVTE